ncbi:MAG: tRNA (adenosine(37)-N6)-threonylcarbamoyltransferase complex transferase subunit TsaD [Terriglobia bacterium]
MVRILGIESSCDETAAAIVADGARILANVISSQIDLHRKYGGVVPELASRAHLEKIVPVVREAFAQAGLSYADVDAIAVTQGPGLIGSLLVGVTFAKTMAWSLAKPLIGVNHLEGHIHAVLLEQRHRNGQLPLEFPVVTLVVSGGHTVLYRVEQEPIAAHPGPATSGFRLRYERIGETVDDAAGEAFDKVAKHLALGYPGGPVIDRLARAVPNLRDDAVVFTKPHIKHGTPYDFSFSGIKTAVVRYVERHGHAPEIEARKTKLRENPKANLAELCSQQTLDLVASFQKTVVEDLTERTLAAADDFNARAVFVSGGVAANSLLRKIFREESAMRGVPVFFPSVALSTDNAAMIAAAAYPKFLAGDFAGLELNADASLPLGR